MKLFVICLGALFVKGAYAQAPQARSSQEYLDAARGMNVSEFVSTALSQNQDLQATREQLKVADGEAAQAALRPNPSVSLQLREGSALNNPGQRIILFGYTHTFELGGKRDRRMEVSSVKQQLTLLDVADRERLLRSGIRMQFGEALAAVRNLSTIEQLLALNQQAHELAKARVEKGDAAQLEEDLLQVEVNRTLSDLTRERNQVETALLGLKRLAGMKLDMPLTIAGRLDAPSGDLSLEEALQKALNQRPDLLAARLTEQLGDAEIRQAEAQGVPNMQGTIGFMRMRQRFPQYGLSATGQSVPLIGGGNALTGTISFDLPFRNRNQGNIEAAVARKSASSLESRYLEQTVREEVRAAYGRYEAAREALKAFDEGVVGASLENLEVVRAAYELGELRILDVLDQQQRYLADQRAYTDLLAEYYFSVVALDQAVGGGVF